MDIKEMKEWEVWCKGSWVFYTWKWFPLWIFVQGQWTWPAFVHKYQEWEVGASIEDSDTFRLCVWICVYKKHYSPANRWFGHDCTKVKYPFCICKEGHFHSSSGCGRSTALHTGHRWDNTVSDIQYPMHTMDAAPCMENTASVFLYLSAVCICVFTGKAHFSAYSMFTCDCTET